MGTESFQLIELTLDEQRRLQREIAAIPGVPRDLVELACTMRFRQASVSFEDFLSRALTIAAGRATPTD